MLGSTTTFSAASVPFCRTRPGASVERAPPWLPGVRSGSGPLVPQLGACLVVVIDVDDVRQPVRGGGEREVADEPRRIALEPRVVLDAIDLRDRDRGRN